MHNLVFFFLIFDSTFGSSVFLFRLYKRWFSTVLREGRVATTTAERIQKEENKEKSRGRREPLNSIETTFALSFSLDLLRPEKKCR